MTWQHPLIVVDQNQLRHPDAIARVLDDCCRNGLRLLLPDGAFLEFSKGGLPFDTARRSLQVIAPHRELVCSSRKVAAMMRDELQQCGRCNTLIENTSSQFLRSILEELERGDETTLGRLVEGPIAEMMPPALEVWNDHEQNRRMVLDLHDALKAEFSTDQLKSLRQAPEKGVADWLSSVNGTRFVFQGLKARGADEETAYDLTRTPSVCAGFLSALAGLAVHWLAFGGLPAAAAKESSGDLNDIEYVVLGALSHSLATSDRRAHAIYKAVALGFEVRQTLPRPSS
jgi:hypothetical protein